MEGQVPILHFNYFNWYYQACNSEVFVFSASDDVSCNLIPRMQFPLNCGEVAVQYN